MSVEIDIVVLHRTAAAVQVALSEDEEGVWLPLDAVTTDDALRPGSIAVIEISEKLAFEKGLI